MTYFTPVCFDCGNESQQVEVVPQPNLKGTIERIMVYHGCMEIRRIECRVYDMHGERIEVPDHALTPAQWKKREAYEKAKINSVWHKAWQMVLSALRESQRIKLGKSA